MAGLTIPSALKHCYLPFSPGDYRTKNEIIQGMEGST
jgi:hypothetical protein